MTFLAHALESLSFTLPGLMWLMLSTSFCNLRGTLVLNKTLPQCELCGSTLAICHRCNHWNLGVSSHASTAFGPCIPVNLYHWDLLLALLALFTVTCKAHLGPLNHSWNNQGTLHHSVKNRDLRQLWEVSLKIHDCPETLPSKYSTLRIFGFM